MTGVELMYELFFYGISAIALDTTGSKQQGLRICTSFVDPAMYGEIEERIKEFHKDHWCEIYNLKVNFVTNLLSNFL